MQTSSLFQSIRSFVLRTLANDTVGEFQSELSTIVNLNLNYEPHPAP